VFQPNFAFRKRTTVGLSRVQKTKKIQRPESFYPPEYESDMYSEARSSDGAVNEAVNVDDNELYVNAHRST